MCKREGCDTPTEGKKMYCPECRKIIKREREIAYREQFRKPVMKEHPCSRGTNKDEPVGFDIL